MKRYLVGMLAVLSLAGCGLEMNESIDENGELVVETSEGALLGDAALEATWPLSPSGATDGGALGGSVGGAAVYATGSAPYGATPVAYGMRALPQDPVPVKPENSTQSGRSTTPDW